MEYGGLHDNLNDGVMFEYLAPAGGTVWEGLELSGLVRGSMTLEAGSGFSRVLSVPPTYGSRWELSAVPAIMDSNILKRQT